MKTKTLVVIGLLAGVSLAGAEQVVNPGETVYTPSYSSFVPFVGDWRIDSGGTLIAGTFGAWTGGTWTGTITGEGNWEVTPHPGVFSLGAIANRIGAGAIVDGVALTTSVRLLVEPGADFSPVSISGIGYYGGVTIRGDAQLANISRVTSEDGTLTIAGVFDAIYAGANGVVRLIDGAYSTSPRPLYIPENGGRVVYANNAAMDYYYMEGHDFAGFPGVEKEGAGDLSVRSTVPVGMIVRDGSVQLLADEFGAVDGGVVISRDGQLAFVADQNRKKNPFADGRISIVGLVSGDGQFLKTGNGTYELDSEIYGAWTGKTEVAEGSLLFTRGSMQGDMDVKQEGTLAWRKSADENYSGAISGPGGFTKEGTGTLTLLGNNTHSGNLSIAAGQLQVGDGGTDGMLTNSKVQIGDGATFAWNKSSNDLFGGNMTGNGTFRKQGSGTLAASGASQVGELNVEDGALDVTGSMIVGGATRVAHSPGQTASLDVTGSFEGRGETWIGAGGNGALRVSGNATTNGLVAANDPGSSAEISVDGGSLSNSGTLQVGNWGKGNITVRNGGRVAQTGAEAYFASVQGSEASLRVGEGSEFATDSALHLGTGSNVGGNASMVVDEGGTVRAQFLHTATKNETTGTASNIEVAGDLLVSENLFLNDRVSVAETGNVEGSEIYIGQQTTAAIAGNLTARETIGVGGAMDANGATIRSGQAANSWSVIGGPNATANLRGGSVWQNIGKLHAGLFGGQTGSLALDSTSSLATNSLEIGSQAGATGRVNLAGTIEAADIRGGDGASEFVFSGGTVRLTGDAPQLFELVGDVRIDRSGTIDTNGYFASLAADLGGTGTLNKAGRGWLTLLGTSGPGLTAEVKEGTLQIGYFGAKGYHGGDIVLSGGDARWSKSTNDIYSGAISGPGGFTKEGSGTLTITGSLAHGGGTVVEGGRLKIGDGGTAGEMPNTSLLLLWSAGEFEWSKSTEDSLATQIRGSGNFLKSGTGTLSLTGDAAIRGGKFWVLEGTLQQGDGGQDGHLDADVEVAPGATFAWNKSTEETLLANVSGGGNFAKRGSGTLTVTGGAWTGGTRIEAGILRLAGDLATSEVYVAQPNSPWPTLSGAGSIAGNLVNAGSVEPTHLLRVGGDFGQLATGRLVVDVQSKTLFSRIEAGGNVALDGALVVLRNPVYIPGVNDELEIISAAGGVSGRFASFIDDGFFDVRYDPSSVWLISRDTPRPDAKDPVTSARKQGFKKLAKAIQTVLEQSISVGLAPLKEIAFTSAQNRQQTAIARRDAGEGSTEWDAWSNVGGLFASVSLANIPRSDFATATFSGGVAKSFGGLQVGPYVGYDATWLGDNTVNSFSTGLQYSFQAKNGLWVAGYTGGALTSYDLRRESPFDSRAATGNPNGYQIETGLAAGWDKQIGRIILTPSIGVQYTHFEVNGYTEQGAGPLSAKVGAQNTDSLRGSAAITAAMPFSAAGWTVTPYLSGNIQAEMLDNGYSVPVSLNGGKGAKITGFAPAGGRVAAGGTLGVQAQRGRLALGLSVGYLGSTTQQTGILNGNVLFEF